MTGLKGDKKGMVNTMFSGKRERELEELLGTAREKNERRRKTFWEICGQKETITEQFARMTASRAQLGKELEQVEEQMHRAAELADSSTVAAGEVHSVMIAVNNAVETFDANHSVFIGQVKNQNEKVKELMGANGQMREPAAGLSGVPELLREDYRAVHERIGQMHESSKNMGVLALNAAIEAGRLGESGKRFIASAEEIRAFSESYEQAAEEIETQLKQSGERILEMEEQIRQLNDFIKENNLSMAKLMSTSMQNMASYESSQLNLRSILSDSAVGQSDALVQSEQETTRIQEQMLEQMGNICSEIEEQKNCADELESIFKGVHQMAEKEISN